MALIKCEECNHEMSDKARQCQYCGFIRQEKIICSECNAENIKKDKVCKNCGLPLKKSLAIHIPNFYNIFHYKKTFAILGVMFLIIIILFFGLFNNDKGKIKKNVNLFFDNLMIGNIESTNNYLNINYDYYDNTHFNTENTKLYLSKYSYKLKDIKITKNYAVVNLELKHPIFSNIISKTTKYLINNSSSNKKEEQEYIKELLENNDLEYETNDIKLSLIKMNNDWKIQVNDDFKLMITYGITSKTENNLSENEKKKQEMKKYIETNLVLNDFIVDYTSKYGKNIPSIKNIEIKNKGNKTITQLDLEIEFLNDNGQVIMTRTVSPISVLDKNLKAGYSWKMENDKFLEIPNIENDIDIEKCNVKISNIVFSTLKEEPVSEEQKYIDDYMQVISYRVKKYEKYTGEILPGLGGLSIKNNGNKELSKVYITVYFQDDNGNNIADNKLLVIGGLFSESNSRTLKANYSWSMGNDGFYEITNLSSEVNLSRHTVEISEIEFAE